MTEPFEPPPREPRRHTGGAVFGALLAVAGLVWLLASLDAVSVSATVAVGALLVLVGLGIVLLPEGGHHGLLVAAGVVLALLGAVAATFDLDLVDGSVGERRERPAALTDVRHEYALGVGSLGIDLTRLEARDGDPGEVSFRARVGIGELVVAVPREAELIVDAHVAIGEVEVRDERRSGFDVRLQLEDEGAGGDGPVFRLLLEGGIGAIRVVDDRLRFEGGDDGAD